MRDEAEIREMACQLLQQIDQVQENNIVAADKLHHRLIALCWVLGKPKPETLILCDKALRFLESLY